MLVQPTFQLSHVGGKRFSPRVSSGHFKRHEEESMDRVTSFIDSLSFELLVLIFEHVGCSMDKHLESLDQVG
jgi:hypothetical protein